MKVRWYWVIIISLVAYIIMSILFEKRTTEAFEKTIEKLEKERDSLRNQKYVYESINDSLEKEKNIIKGNIDSLKTQIDSLKKPRYEIRSIISDMDERKLDSILTNYRSPKRN